MENVDNSDLEVFNSEPHLDVLWLFCNYSLEEICKNIHKWGTGGFLSENNENYVAVQELFLFCNKTSYWGLVSKWKFLMQTSVNKIFTT